jgi:hypothetical protein
MRIVKYSHKVLIVLGVVLLVSSAGIVAVDAGMDKPLTFGIVSLAETAAIWGITRFFRGESEALRPPRPWWRMTELPSSAARGLCTSRSRPQCRSRAPSPGAPLLPSRPSASSRSPRS